MFLTDKKSGDLVRIVDLEVLFDPFHQVVEGRGQAGEEEQELETFDKQQLAFVSGESLPRCWLDPDRQHTRQTAGSASHI